MINSSTFSSTSPILLYEAWNTEIGIETPENNESEVDSDKYTGDQKIQHSSEMKN